MKKVFPLVLLLGILAGAHAHGMSEADKLAMLEGGNLRYLWLGAVHMVTGYDHLLFLFGVIFYLTGMRDILKFVTVFTVGHSITLVAATYAGITANYYLVDAVVALSVCYKAFDNLDGFRKYLRFKSPNLLAMILIFGLIHGFGLSTRLQQLPLPEEGLIFRILSFNVGVELGQIVALSVLVALLAGWRKTDSFRKLGGIANFLLLLAGIGLFTYQMISYFRGDTHHDEAPHEIHLHDETGHPYHGESDHPPHGIHPEHTEPAHPHEETGHGHSHAPSDTESSAVRENLDSAGSHGHSHGGHSHDHDHEGETKPKKDTKKAHTHSHEAGVPHSH